MVACARYFTYEQEVICYEHELVILTDVRRSTPLTSLSPLPHWDMTVVYPSLDSKEFSHGFLQVQAEIASLSKLFDTEQIGQCPPAPMEPAIVARFDSVIERLNVVLDKTNTL